MTAQPYISDRRCPSCAAALNRLDNRDGFGAELTFAPVNRWVVERRVVATVYACPSCEHVETGPRS